MFVEEAALAKMEAAVPGFIANGGSQYVGAWKFICGVDRYLPTGPVPYLNGYETTDLLAVALFGPILNQFFLVREGSNPDPNPNPGATLTLTQVIMEKALTLTLTLALTLTLTPLPFRSRDRLLTRPLP